MIWTEVMSRYRHFLEKCRFFPFFHVFDLLPRLKVYDCMCGICGIWLTHTPYLGSITYCKEKVSLLNQKFILKEKLQHPRSHPPPWKSVDAKPLFGSLERWLVEFGNLCQDFQVTSPNPRRSEKENRTLFDYIELSDYLKVKIDGTDTRR